MELHADQVEWKLTSYIQMDHIGKVFSWDGRIFRAIFQDRAPYVQWLFDSGIVSSLVQKGLLVETSIRPDFTLDGFGMILEHKKIPFPSKAATWPFPVFKQAALLFLDLNIELFKYGLCTVDGHQENTFLTESSRPVWIDFGSILPIEEVGGENALKQFVGCYLNILILQQTKPMLNGILRTVLHKKESVIQEEFESITGIKYDFPFNSRLECLRLLRSIVSKIEIGTLKTQWQTYHKAEDYMLLDSSSSPDTRYKLLNDLLCRLKPESVVDVACNAGKFSLLAAHHGADVYAFDVDEPALNQFYQKLQGFENRFSVCIASHGFFSWLGGDRFDYMREINPNVNGDLVLALAITHHLSLSQSVSFDNIAKKLVSYTGRFLLVEFMPYGLNNTKTTPHNIPEWYTLDNFIASFEPYFETVSIFFYPVKENWSFRVLVFFEVRRETGSSMPMKRKVYYYALDRLGKNEMVLRTVCMYCGDRGLHRAARMLICAKCGQPLRGTIYASSQPAGELTQ